MATKRRLNVLVYNDAGTTRTCVNQCIYTLRRLLSPRYAVVPVTRLMICTEPWARTCALLVLPGGADLGYCQALEGAGNSAITAYLRSGGRMIAFCAGAYYCSDKCEFEVGTPLQVVGPRPIGLFGGICRGAAFGGFKYQSEQGARAALVRPVGAAGRFQSGSEPFRVYFNGGGVFVDAQATANCEVIATYAEQVKVDGGDGAEAAAVVMCRIANLDQGDDPGKAVLSGVHLEFSPLNLDSGEPVAGYRELIRRLEQDDHTRLVFLTECFRAIDLDPNPVPVAIPTLTEMHLTSSQPGGGAAILDLLSADLVGADGGLDVRLDGAEFVGKLSCLADQFAFYRPASAAEPTDEQRTDEQRTAADGGLVDYKKVLKQIVVHPDGALPDSTRTPWFNHQRYFSSLEAAVAEAEALDRGCIRQRFGSTLLYGRVVTSTNTLLYENTDLCRFLPAGTTFVATTQVAGRGRGSNPWISPPGSLILSSVVDLRQPRQDSTAGSTLQFMQYLCAIAVMRAIHGFVRPGEKPAKRASEGGLAVAVKWPNDVYARPAGSDRWLKIGGWLVQLFYSAAASSVRAIVGIGINVAIPGDPASAVPTVSLNQVADSYGVDQFDIETLVGRINVGLESAIDQFDRNGWKGQLENEYLASWLHSGQLIKIDRPDITASTRSSTTSSSSCDPRPDQEQPYARILGVTADWGELLVEEHRIDQNRVGQAHAIATLASDDSGSREAGGPAGSTVGRPTGRFWRLQPDNNSFDFFTGLIVKKL